MTTSVTEIRDVAKKKAGRPRKPHGESAQVRMPSDIASMAKAIAQSRGVAFVDYMELLLRSPVERDFARMVERLKKHGEAE